MFLTASLCNRCDLPLLLADLRLLAADLRLLAADLTQAAQVVLGPLLVKTWKSGKICPLRHGECGLGDNELSGFPAQSCPHSSDLA